GGTFKPNSDAQKVFENPEAYNFLALEWPGRSKKIGLFFPGLYRMEGKVQTKFGKYLQRKSGILIPEDSELYNLSFYESDKDKAREIIQNDIAQFEAAGEAKAALKAKMYFPEEP